jgi:hypothetical protein
VRWWCQPWIAEGTLRSLRHLGDTLNNIGWSQEIILHK